MGRLAELYRGLYSKENVLKEAVINSIPRLPVYIGAWDFNAKKELSKGKAPGKDGIPAEMPQGA